MWRLIFLGLVIWLMVYWVKRHIRSSNKPNATDAQSQSETASNDTSEKVEDMVQCAH